MVVVGGISGGWLCSLTIWVTDSSSLLLQAVNTSSLCFLKNLQGEWVKLLENGEEEHAL